MSLFQFGAFFLSSGVPSPWKIECDNLDDGDIATLAQLVRRVVGPFHAVQGVPRGGLRLASALQPFVTIDGPRLLVDDVLTTGKSMSALRDEIYLNDGIDRVARPHYVKGCVLFARGQCPYWISAVFQTPEALWLQPRKR
jgi:orotate phosphoribosyltransferase